MEIKLFITEDQIRKLMPHVEWGVRRDQDAITLRLAKVKLRELGYDAG